MDRGRSMISSKPSSICIVASAEQWELIGEGGYVCMFDFRRNLFKKVADVAISGGSHSVIPQ